MLHTNHTIAAFSILLALCASGRETRAQSAESSVTLYGGPASHNSASEVFLHGEFKIDGPMIGLAYNREIVRLGERWTLEGEAQVTHFFTDADYSTIGAGLGLRYHFSEWFKHTGSIALLMGPSYSDDPHLYNGAERRLLNYVAAELAVLNLNNSEWDGVIRLFHRSGLFGVYAQHADAGLEVGVGIRRRF